MDGKERYIVTSPFRAATVVNDESCASHRDSGFDDEEFRVGNLIWAYPASAGLVRFTTVLSTFCVEATVFGECTERNFLELERG